MLQEPVNESARLEKAELEIQKLLRLNSELTARCEFLQQNFNGDYNELLIEYQALNQAFEILQLRTTKSPTPSAFISDEDHLRWSTVASESGLANSYHALEKCNGLKKHKHCI